MSKKLVAIFKIAKLASMEQTAYGLIFHFWDDKSMLHNHHPTSVF